MKPGETILLQTKLFRVVEIQSAGKDGQLRQRAVVRHPGAVTIVPMVDASHVCLIRNRRPAVDKTLIELPAGTLEPGETAAVTAARELTEETGYVAGRLTPLREFYLSPGILDERIHLYLAEQLTMGSPQREPGEEIENWVVSLSTALELIDRGEIEDAKSMVGLLFYARLRSG